MTEHAHVTVCSSLYYVATFCKNLLRILELVVPGGAVQKTAQPLLNDHDSTLYRLSKCRVITLTWMTTLPAVAVVSLYLCDTSAHTRAVERRAAAPPRKYEANSWLGVPRGRHVGHDISWVPAECNRVHRKFQSVFWRYKKKIVVNDGISDAPAQWRTVFGTTHREPLGYGKTRTPRDLISRSRLGG